jgi:protein-disulfide isomerase
MEDVKESVASLAATVKNPRTRAAHKQFAAYYNETQGGRIYLAGRPKAGDAALVLQAADPALAAWNAAKDTESVSVLEAFIARFGDSFYAALAKAKLAELKKKEAETEVAVGVFPKSEAEAEEIYRSPASFVAGNPDGDVSVVEFFDYNCGYCRRALPDVVKLIDTDDKVRVVLKELAIFGEDSEAAARAALAANKQGKYFEMHQKLFSEPGKANKEKALQIAQELGMDVEQLEQDMEDPEIQKTLDETLALAGKLGLKGTPYYLIGDRSLPGAPDDLYDQLTKKIAEVREKGCQTTC